MMGVADFPVEILKSLKIKPSESSVESKGSYRPTSKSELSQISLPEPSIITDTQIEGQTKSAGSSKVSLTSLQTNTSGTESQLGPTDSQDSSSSQSRVAHPITDSEENQKSSKPEGKITHPASMKSALKESMSRSRSRSSSPSRQSGHPHRSLSNTQAGQMSVEAALGAGKSIKQIVGTGLKSPMDFTLSIARGFHNAPKLYGDESVRQADKVTDLQSGLKAAGKV